MRGDGRIYQRGNRWWIEYWFRGKQYREPGGPTEPKAQKKLKARMKEIYGDRFVGPQEQRLTVDELLDNLVLHLETKGAKAAYSYGSYLEPLRAYFALTRACDLTTSHVEKFMQERLKAGKKGKAPATVNRSVAALRQAYLLARKQGRLNRVPYFPMLKEDNARQGFFERAEFEAVAALLPEPVNDVARFAYLSGWRKGEILSLTWDRVDRAGGEVRLRTSKNGHGRVLPLTGELAALVERRWLSREFKGPEGMTGLSEYVFHRKGRPIVDLRKAWAKACKDAKVPGRLFHDLRRTAVRDMMRAGVPQSVAMSISGHRTVSVFLRYNITSGDDQREALRRMEAHRSAQPIKRNVEEFPQSGQR